MAEGTMDLKQFLTVEKVGAAGGKLDLGFVVRRQACDGQG
jgi:hypothetical protein